MTKRARSRRKRETTLTKLNLKVADFTSRLPGPLAGALLADLGAEVSKIEVQGWEDPFLTGKEEPIFAVWAKNFFEKKKIVRLERDDEEKIDAILRESDVVLCPPSKFFKRLMQKHPYTAFVEIIGGSGPQKYLHDLNALFLTRSFKLHLQGQSEPSPPYLPFAGIIFAQQIALETMAAHMRKSSNPSSENSKVYLDQAAKGVLDKLWGQDMEERATFLHNGKFPCYNIYKTLDGHYIALAAVESRFWSEFSNIFGMNLTMEQRFDISGKTGQKLSEMFLKYKASEIKEIIKGRDVCVNIFPAGNKD